jgi:long-chain fatty acid transport protein
MSNMLRTSILALCFVAVSSEARAAGFYLGEHDAVAQGRGLAVTAMLDDASSVFFNPAALAFLDGLNLRLGGLVIVPTFQYADPAGKRGSATADESPIIAPNLYASYTFERKGAIGVGFNSPFGLSLQWPKGFAGESINAGSDLKCPSIYIAGAYRPIERLSIGATLRLVPATVEMLQQFKVATDAGSMVYGWAHLGASAFGVGASVGVQARPVDRLYIGFSYLSRVKLNFDNGAAHFDFDLGGDQFRDNTVFHDQGGSTSITLPDVFSFGVGYDIVAEPEHRLYAEFDVNYTLWSTYKQLQVNFDNDPSGTLSKPTRKDFQDVPCYRLGLEYRYKDFLVAKMAGVYDVSPVPDDTLGPELPDANRIVGYVGLGYRYAPLGLRADVAYTFVYFEKRTVTEAAGNPFPAEYASYGHMIGFSVGLGSGEEPAATEAEPEETVDEIPAPPAPIEGGPEAAPEAAPAPEAPLPAPEALPPVK